MKFKYECMVFLTNFIQVFALLTPADGSPNLFMFEIMTANAFLEKTKTY